MRDVAPAMHAPQFDYPMETRMKARILVPAVAVFSLLVLSFAYAQPDGNQSAQQQSKTVQHQSQSATQQKTPEAAKHVSGNGFDTRSSSPTPVKAVSAPKASPVGQKTSDYHPAPKTSKPLDKSSVPPPSH